MCQLLSLNGISGVQVNNVQELIVWPNCKTHGRNDMRVHVGKGEQWHHCTQCSHKEHESLCKKCNSTVDVIPESQASAILRCRNCRIEEVVLF